MKANTGYEVRQASGQKSLDQILSAAFFFVDKWTPALTRNKSPYLLRHLLCRLYGASKGNLFRAQIRASQESLAAALELSREWTCKLSGRLQDAGWIEYYAPQLPDGKYEIGVYRPGRMLKRLLCLLLGYRKPRHGRVNDFSQSFPLLTDKEKKVLTSRWQKEKEPPPEQVLKRIPILREWMEREKGKEK